MFKNRSTNSSEIIKFHKKTVSGNAPVFVFVLGDIFSDLGSILAPFWVHWGAFFALKNMGFLPEALEGVPGCTFGRPKAFSRRF